MLYSTRRWPSRRLAFSALLAAAAGVPSAARGQVTYYVSPAGNDSNSGLSPDQAWASVAKVDATSFAPGSSILFQRGGNWYDSLVASSSGTTAAPITYGAYGSGTNPTFWGSDVLNAANFTPIAGSPGSDPTYSMAYPTAVNSVLEDHQFLHSATLVDTSAPANAAPSAYVSYVENTPDTWYFDSSPNVDQLYVNTGSTVSVADGHVYTAAVRQNAVASNSQSNLVFDGLSVAETANFNAGYGFDIQSSANVTVENSTATGTGKHAFSVLNSTNFVGKNLATSNSMPDQGFGGASAYVAYSDFRDVGDTSTWSNLTYTNANGPYPVFISHGDPNAVGSVSLSNLSGSGYGTGIIVYSTSATEKLSIQNATFDNGQIGIETNNTVINGVMLTGPLSNVSLSGNGDILQNSIITGNLQDVQGGHNGAVYVAGANDVIRNNTIVQAGGADILSPFVGIAGSASNTVIYGNIFDGTGLYIFKNFAGPSTIASNNNLFSQPGMLLQFLGPSGGDSVETFTQWVQNEGEDANSSITPPIFAASGGYYLMPGTFGSGTYAAGPGKGVATDFYGNPRPAAGQASDIGAVQGTDIPLNLDLATNSLWIGYGEPLNDPISAVVAELAGSFRGPSGAWTGSGITSSAAAANPGKFSVGYIDGATDADNVIPKNSILVSYTLAADTNLDGSVGFADLIAVAESFGSTGRDWFHGNLNYDPEGSVGFADLALIAQEFGQSVTNFQNMQASPQLSAAWLMARESAAVPEPGASFIGFIFAASLPLARRRFRRVLDYGR